MITHPAGFDAVLQGSEGQKTEQGHTFAVSQETPQGSLLWEDVFDTAEEAVVRFLTTRTEQQLGADHEGS